MLGSIHIMRERDFPRSKHFSINVGFSIHPSSALRRLTLAHQGRVLYPNLENNIKIAIWPWISTLCYSCVCFGIIRYIYACVGHMLAL